MNRVQKYFDLIPLYPSLSVCPLSLRKSRSLNLNISMALHFYFALIAKRAQCLYFSQVGAQIPYCLRIKNGDLIASLS